MFLAYRNKQGHQIEILKMGKHWQLSINGRTFSKSGVSKKYKYWRCSSYYATGCKATARAINTDKTLKRIQLLTHEHNHEGNVKGCKKFKTKLTKVN